MLQRGSLSEMDVQHLPMFLDQIVSLPFDAVRAYRTSLEGLEPLLDPEVKLLHDHLIEPFNDVAASFEDLCDLKAGRDLAVNS